MPKKIQKKKKNKTEPQVQETRPKDFLDLIAPAAVMTTFITFKQFDIVYLLTQQKGYMTGANLNTVITYAYQNAFVSNNYGLSSAVSMLLFVLIILFSLATNRSLREE